MKKKKAIWTKKDKEFLKKTKKWEKAWKEAKIPSPHNLLCIAMFERKIFQILKISTLIDVMGKKRPKSIEKPVEIKRIREAIGFEMDDEDFNECIRTMKLSGDIFEPKRGYVQVI